MFLVDKNYIECTVNFKIKENNSVNDTQIQQNVDFLLRADGLEWIITHFLMYI